jgi:hypothetical protein
VAGHLKSRQRDAEHHGLPSGASGGRRMSEHRVSVRRMGER